MSKLKTILLIVGALLHVPSAAGDPASVAWRSNPVMGGLQNESRESVTDSAIVRPTRPMAEPATGDGTIRSSFEHEAAGLLKTSADRRSSGRGQLSAGVIHTEDTSRFALDYATTFVGDFAYLWPFRSTSLYRPIPAWRYNRVEGLVLGLRKKPLEWDSYERVGPYGQFGYAFASKRWNYEVGAEVRLGERYGEERADLKIGGAYRRLTATDDLWKSSWAENTMAAFFFNYDFFDYHETEGWTVYAAARAAPYFQFTAGYRSDEYRSLGRETGWSIFGGDNFRFNPVADEGNMRSLVFAFEGGRIQRFRSLPRGAVFRVEAEIGQGLGGDFSYNRIVVDGRGYLRISRTSSLALRIRGGSATASVPAQKAFTIGGIGSVRGYPQNGFFGRKMLLGNAEYAVSDLLDGWLGGLQVSGFFDAGWVRIPDDPSFKIEDVFTSAGIGLGLFERQLRLELAFPLTDRGGTKDPALWLRLIPAF